MIDWSKCGEQISIGGEKVVVPTLKGIECVFKVFLNLSIRVAGILLFIMLIIGGFRYLTSGGDSKQIEAAKQTITYALLGMVLLLGGWLILLFIRELTGIDVTTFIIS